LFIIHSHESLKITQSFQIGSFWAIELPLRLFYHKKSIALSYMSLSYSTDVLFTGALVTGPFELE
jgi:hypothetical protein